MRTASTGILKTGLLYSLPLRKPRPRKHYMRTPVTQGLTENRVSETNTEPHNKPWDKTGHTPSYN